MTDHDPAPSQRRRKDARPAEIVEAALGVFAEKGYARANLNEVARRAGVSKGTLYVYFESKEALFRAVADQLASSNAALIAKAQAPFGTTINEIIPALLATAARQIAAGPATKLFRMVLADARQFPDLATIWHDRVVATTIDLLARVLADAQARGEVRDGDPRLLVFSVAGPVVAALILQSTLGDRPALPDLDLLARNHAAVILDGLRTDAPQA